MSESSAKILLYFGCIGKTGHYMWSSEAQTLPSKAWQEILACSDYVRELLGQHVDDGFTPKSNRAQGHAAVHRLGELLILAWCDYTIDSRGGSHSTFIGKGYTDDAEELLRDATVKFPEVIKRQTVPLWRGDNDVRPVWKDEHSTKPLIRPQTPADSQLPAWESPITTKLVFQRKEPNDRA